MSQAAAGSPDERPDSGGEQATVKAAVGLGAVTAVSRVVGLLRVLVVAWVLSIDALGDAFQAANSLSNVLFELLAAGALSAVLVPAFVDLLDRGDQKGAEEVAGGVLGLAVVGLGAIVVVGIVAAPLLTDLLTLGLDGPQADQQRELITFLLRFFLPQVVLYAAGTVATGVLFSKRRFLATAAAPIGNTVVMVAALLVFRAVAGPAPGLDLDGGERALLVVAGTGGVVAFVGILLWACRATGFRLRPRWPGRDPRVLAVARSAGWGVVLHSSAGAILGGAIVASSGVDGAVVAYQSAWVFFLAPYGVLAHPIHTAILPELVTESKDPDLTRFRTSVRWAMERMTVAIVPVSALLIALAGPGMRIVASRIPGTADSTTYLAVALATLAVGLLPYSAFLMLARVFYALDDSRKPAMVSLVVAGVGLSILAVGAPLTDGAARIAVLGLAHSASYTVGSALLVVAINRRTGGSVLSPVIGVLSLVGALVAGGGWLVAHALLAGRSGLLADFTVSLLVAVAAAGVLFGFYRFTGQAGRMTKRIGEPAP